MTAFSRAANRLHRVGIRRLADSVAEYLDRDGLQLAENLLVVVDHAAERYDSFGCFGRWTTIAFLTEDVARVDTEGRFVVGGKTWVIDGIASDDGRVMSFYVRP